MLRLFLLVWSFMSIINLTGAQTVTEVIVDPGTPLVVRDFSITLKGYFPNGCYTGATITKVSVSGRYIDLDVAVSRTTNTICTQALVPFETSTKLRVNDPGEYEIRTNGINLESPQYVVVDEEGIIFEGLCTKAIPISCGNTINSSTSSETNSISSYNCLPSSLVGPDKVYSFTLSQATTVNVRMAIQALGLDLDVFIFDGCSGEVRNCVAESSADNRSSNLENISTYLEEGTYYIVVDGQYSTSRGSFQLSLSCSNVNTGGGGEGGGGSPSNICEKATPINCGSTTSGSTNSETNIISSYNCLTASTLVGPEKVYSFTLSQTTTVTLDMSILAQGLDLDLFLLSGCGNNSCIAESSSDNRLSNKEVISKTLNPGTYYIVIDGQFSTSRGSFQLSLNCGNTGGGGEGGGSICSKAVPISCGNTVNSTTVGGTNQLQNYDCLGGFTLVGPEKVYKFTLTQTTTVSIALAIQTSGLDLDLFLMGDVCNYFSGENDVFKVSGDICIAESSSDNRSSNRENITKTLGPGTYYIVIDGQFSYSQGAFQLSLVCGGNEGGSICSKAMPISCGNTLNGTTVNESNLLREYDCLGGFTLLGPEKVYKLVLTQRTSVSIDLAIQNAGLDLDLFLLGDVCNYFSGENDVFKVSGDICIAESSSDNRISNRENITRILDPGTYYIIVDGQFTTSMGAFQISVSCGQNGSICEKATPINCGTTLSGSTVAETNILSSYNCLTASTFVGPEKAYKFTLSQRTPVTINMAIQTLGLDLDLFLLRECNNIQFGATSQCVAESSSDNRTTNQEAITITLDPGTYYIVVDGQFVSSAGAFQLSVNCCEQAQKNYNCGSISYRYTGTGGSLKFAFSSTQSIAPGRRWLVNNQEISYATGNNFEYTFPSVGNYEVCFPYINASGCLEYCCYNVYVSNPFECFDFDYLYSQTSDGFQFRLNRTGASNISWIVDDTGQGLGSGSTSNLLPRPGTCVFRTITVKYYWNGRWYICCRTIWLCNPFDCYDFDYRFVSNVESSGYQFDLNKPGASNISWIVDDTGQNLGTGNASSLLPVPGTCIRRTISVRYFWNGRWYICCRSIWLCNPLDCTPIVYRYVPNQGFQFTLTEPGTTSQSWTIDETGQDIGTGLNTQYVRPPSNCVNYTISVRYFKNGIWYFCCLRIRLCDPLSCNVIRYVTQSNGYELTLDDTNAEQISWLDDDNNSQVLVTGTPTTVVPLPTPCRDRLISVRYYDPISRTWRYCCVLIKCGTPPPSCTNDNCNLIAYRYFENTGFQFTLSQAGASNISWSVLETGQQLGTGVTIGGLRPLADCQVRTFVVQYTLNGQVYTCCRKIWLCNPFNCNPIIYKYSEQGYQFTLDEPGTSNQTWTIDETNEDIGEGLISTFVRPPSNGNCITRTISVRYYKNGTWYFCCQRIVICDPFNCQSLVYNVTGSNYELSLDDGNANQIVWLDDNNNGAVLNQNVRVISVPAPTPCVDRIISVRYYDPISQTWRYCCVRIPCGQQSCQLSVSPSTLNFSKTGGEQTVTVTANSTWNVATPSVSWLRVTTLLGTNLLRIQVDPNNSTQARSGTVSLSCSGNRVSIQINQEAGGSGGTGGGTPPWGEPTSSLLSHTVAVLRNVDAEVGGNPLQVGDYFGFFYKASNGTLVIAGKKIWEDKNTLITVNGDDPSTPNEQEGFKDGEVLVLKVWRAADQQVYDVNADYLSIGTAIGNAFVDATDKFKNQALSAIGKLRSGNNATHDILLKKGWNLISSKVTPQAPDMEVVFQPIIDQIQLVKSISASFVPGFSNDLGNWDILQGYFVKAKNDVTLSIPGSRIDPNQVSIPLREGWQIVPYFCDVNRPVGEIFSDPALGITAVKSLTNTYIPGFSSPDEICMQPGQAFQVQIRNGTKRQLLLNCGGATCTALRDPIVPELRGDEAQVITAHNASILFYKELLTQLPIESVVKVWDKQGVLRGQQTFTGQNLQVIIWGDDPYTREKDGLWENEAFEVHFVTPDGSTLKLEDLNVSLPSLTYRTNDLIWAKTSRVSLPLLRSKVLLAPNPTQESTWLHLDLIQSSQVIIAVTDVQGRLIRPELKLKLDKGRHKEELQLADINPGVYLVKVTFADYSQTHRLIIQ
ncbi:pre-peptidase C-terminal domain-containing protein [Haliscomenobacter sp.]|uniref:pre-peptidase C-terminal domain-containing protein n=1 Tax=Haliscomenobacter sp. TaxID=2717303 RepID=UPI00359331F7